MSHNEVTCTRTVLKCSHGDVAIAHIAMVRMEGGGRSSDYIEQFPVTNFFRKILGKSLKKPKRYAPWQKHCIWLTLSSGTNAYIYCASRREANELKEEILSLINDQY